MTAAILLRVAGQMILRARLRRVILVRVRIGPLTITVRRWATVVAFRRPS